MGCFRGLHVRRDAARQYHPRSWSSSVLPPFSRRLPVVSTGHKHYRRRRLNFPALNCSACLLRGVHVPNVNPNAVPFWFRETQLKPYQKAYRIVGDGDTRNPLERSLMNSCVCTGDTRYADVAAQLFTAEVGGRITQEAAHFFFLGGVRAAQPRSTRGAASWEWVRSAIFQPPRWQAARALTRKYRAFRKASHQGFCHGSFCFHPAHAKAG